MAGPSGSRRRQRSEDPASASCWRTVSARGTLSVLPSKLDDVATSLSEAGQGMLLRWSDAFGGVPVALDRLVVDPRDPHGRTVFDHPHVHYTVDMVATVFRPVPGMLLTGRVVAAAQTHIGVLVAGVFNAAVVAAQMEGCRWTPPEAWVHGTGADGRKVGIGALVRVAVLRVHEVEGIISIDAKVDGLVEAAE